METVAGTGFPFPTCKFVLSESTILLPLKRLTSFFDLFFTPS